MLAEHAYRAITCALLGQSNSVGWPDPEEVEVRAKEPVHVAMSATWTVLERNRQLFDFRARFLDVDGARDSAWRGCASRIGTPILRGWRLAGSSLRACCVVRVSAASNQGRGNCDEHEQTTLAH